MNLFQVVDFIKKHGLKGPEGTYPKEGQYTQVLYCIVWVAYPKEGKQTQHSGMHAYCMRLYRIIKYVMAWYSVEKGPIYAGMTRLKSFAFSSH